MVRSQPSRGLPTDARANERKLERETGFEPATSTLARSHSTTELFPLARTLTVPHGPVGFNRHGPDRPPHTFTSPSTRAPSSGDVGLMENPFPHSNPAAVVSRGINSRCQW